jgi:carboxymethylenebutenolidase
MTTLDHLPIPSSTAQLADDAMALLASEADASKPRLSAPSRRGFMARSGAAFGVGYALAAGEVMAQTAIKTPSDGLTVGEVMLDVGGHKMPVYRAAPAGKTNLPVVLVVSEIFGVHEYIADTCRRFARAGYMALAPEYFGRQGDPSSYSEIAKLVAEVISKTPDAQVVSDSQAALKWAAANGGNTAKVGVTGFCWGGRQTWLLNAALPEIKAGVAWYGRLLGATNPLQPSHPVDVVAKLNGPVLGLYGEKDTGIPLDTVDKMKSVLAGGNAAAKKSEFVIYPDAPHAFHADYRPSFRKEAAEDGWKRCLAWFAAQGVA